MTDPSSKHDTPEYLAPYKLAVQTLGSGFEATLWASEQSQRKRFEVFEQMSVEGHFAGQRILDAGCGHGDLAQWLIERKVPFEAYLGLDAVAETVSSAEKRQLANTEFEVADLLHADERMKNWRPDVVLISGTINTMNMEEVQLLLEESWQACGKQLIFNFLSSRTWRETENENLYPGRRHDPQALLHWAFEKTWHVKFRQDYFEGGHDATISLVKRTMA